MTKFSKYKKPTHISNFRSSRKKGVLDIEFMVSILVFLTALSFVAISLISNIPKLHQESHSQDLKSKAFQVSEMILFDPGEPKNWDTVLLADENAVKRIGLSNQTRYHIKTEKVAALRSYCSTSGKYENVKKLLALDFRNEVSIEIRDIDPLLPIDLNCGPSVASKTRPKAVSTRFAVDSLSNRVKVIRVTIL